MAYFILMGRNKDDLPTVYIPDEKVRELRGLFSTLRHLADSSEHMSEFYQRMKVGKSAAKSRMALIRKIVVSSYHMLNKKEKYYWVSDEQYDKKLRDFHSELTKIKTSAKEVLGEKKIA